MNDLTMTAETLHVLQLIAWLCVAAWIGHRAIAWWMGRQL